MKLDRNINQSGLGKYALINLRRLHQDGGNIHWQGEGKYGLVSVPNEYVEFGNGIHDEFFVIKLKDKYASVTLSAYANAARDDDSEYADEIENLARRAGPNHPLCKKPD